MPSGQRHQDLGPSSYGEERPATDTLFQQGSAAPRPDEARKRARRNETKSGVGQVLALVADTVLDLCLTGCPKYVEPLHGHLRLYP